ncbi:dicarboxylate/amino acid:cation symporter [Aestuariicella hydrocarbonica]|uniref:Dicarboxylate/amino acid:cation symporter n=1 Tax=Pseudomaricurvus hydrocarbonicus TaxID=1470433 RepID=A0A9E5MPP6_9GAMM|nr:dicarboxylate/amino acid:cation symporter [Aestuariicella hydrocarbonica]NHO68203.1 dicarboxylate/amino acid:cation symporter [Aestuariicella hydrocarbonica]
MSLTSRILIAMAAGLGVGILINLVNATGWLWPAMDYGLNEIVVVGVFDAVGRIFVASLKLLVVPLVFVSLVCGASGLGESSRMGAMAAKTLLLYLITTAIAISLALLLGTIIRPGDGIGMGEASTFASQSAPSLKDVIVNIFPSNPVKAMADGNMLQVIVFSILMGIAISRSGNHGQQIRAWFENMNEIIMKMVGILMELAPYGVFCLLAKLFAELGAGAILELGLYFSTVLLALLLHGFGVYGLLLKLLTRVNPLTFFKHLRPVMMFAFSTASSSATLPVTLRTAEEKLGVDNRVASFTIPLGATINMDGTAIMQGVATAFIAQAYQIDIGLTGYLTVILTATLASIGTAGVPGVGLITLAMVLQQVGLPVEGIALIIGVDRLLDMIRTAVNVTGDSMVTMTVAKSEGAWDQQVFETEAKAETQKA